MTNVIKFPTTTFDPTVPPEIGEKRIHCVVRTLSGAPKEHMQHIEVRWIKLDIVAAWAAVVSYLAARHKNGANHDVVKSVMQSCKRLPSTNHGRGVFSFIYSSEDGRSDKVFEVRMMEL